MEVQTEGLLHGLLQLEKFFILQGGLLLQLPVMLTNDFIFYGSSSAH